MQIIIGNTRDEPANKCQGQSCKKLIYLHFLYNNIKKLQQADFLYHINTAGHLYNVNHCNASHEKEDEVLLHQKSSKSLLDSYVL